MNDNSMNLYEQRNVCAFGRSVEGGLLNETEGAANEKAMTKVISKFTKSSERQMKSERQSKSVAREKTNKKVNLNMPNVL